jgi:putative SOS response-associated peptidase YedK
MCFRVDQDGKDNGKGIRLMSSEFRAYLDSPAFKALWASVSSESVHPLGSIGIVRIHAETRKPEALKSTWGLLPDRSWVDGKAKGRCCYNAREDTVFEKPSFKEAILKKRCLIPAAAFWEWSEAEHEPDGKKHLYQVTREDGEPFLLGGLWEFHPQFGFSSTVLTTEAIPQVAEEAHHDRSPLVLEPEQAAEWSDPGNQDRHRVKKQLRAWNGARLKITRMK